MNRFQYALAFALLGYPAQAWAATAHDFFPVCAAQSPAQGQTLIVDPSGSQKNAYPTIVAAQKFAKPGDKIDLMTGDYGVVTIDGRNADFITIEAASGQTPKFTRIAIGRHGGASRWRIAGLTVSSLGSRSSNGATVHPPLVDMNNSDNVIFEHNDLFSQAGDFPWQSETNGAPGAPAVSDGISADQNSCISFIENRISNVFNAVYIGGDQTDERGKYYVLVGNTIENFAGDGIDHSASHLRIIHNRITNGHDICDSKCVHTDGIQGWNWHNKPGLVNTDVVIDSNTIIAQTKPDLILPATDLHGITIFDGRWDGVQVSNNSIVTDTWHGITINWTINGSIINNTVAPTNPKRHTWIAFGADKKDPPDTQYNFVIRNNVTPAMGVGKREASLPGVAIDHNLVLSDDDYADNFVKFDPEHFAYDLHPTKRSDAKGEGSADGAPAVDIDGQPRKGKIDIGAYAYQGN